MPFQSNNTGGPFHSRPDRPKPVTVEQKLDDIIRRLGRIEKHLIDVRESVETTPGQPRYVIEPPQFP
ncbi:MAG TPA: hypothetical protein VF624_00465 [Tepidisphaeraceae bacterium]